MNAKFNFTMTSSGRCGTLKYQSENKKIIIDFEVSGTPQHDILIAPLDLREWNIPKGESISLENQLEILKELRFWLKDQRLKSDIVPPPKDDFGRESCVWNGCQELKLKGIAYCQMHYDINLLKN